MKESWVWGLLHGAVWGFVAAVALSVLVLASGCYRAWGADLHTGPYYNGYSEDGYSYRDGLFYKGDAAYSRYKVEWYENVPGYSSYGYGSYPTYRQQKYYKWVYTPAVYAPPYVPPKAEAPSYGKGWQGQLLSIAANRDKVEGSLRTAALDHNAYLAAVRALGLENNFRWLGYGVPPAYPYSAPAAPYAAPNLSTAGANGATIYGYTYSAVRDLYADNNLAVLYQQAARSTDRAQQLAGQAHTDLVDLAGREGGARARVAEALAAGLAAAQALQAAKPSASQHTESRTFSFRLEAGANGGQTLVPVDPAQPDVTPGAQPGAQPQPGAAPQPLPPAMPRAQGGDGRAALAALLGARCASCHGAREPRGGFAAPTYFGMAPADKMRVWSRVMADGDKRMPPPGSGPALTQEEKRLFLTN